MNQLDTTVRPDSDRTDGTRTDQQDDKTPTLGEPAGEPTISPDVAFDVLRNARRRYVLYFLREKSPRELGDLAERIAARENDTTVEGLSSKQRKSVYTALYQTHLPKLADAGVIEYDRDRGVVWLADAADQLDPYLDARGTDGQWSRYFLGLSVVGGLFVLANGMGVAPLTAVPSIALVVALISAFIALSIAYAANNG
jgi:DNA-binding transcriptional ArsR family regulator